jgi:hypothetical protein
MQCKILKNHTFLFGAGFCHRYNAAPCSFDLRSGSATLLDTIFSVENRVLLLPEILDNVLYHEVKYTVSESLVTENYGYP